MVDAHEEALNKACIQALDALNQFVQACGGGKAPFTFIHPTPGSSQENQWYENSKNRLESHQPDDWCECLMREAGRTAEGLDNPALRSQFGRSVDVLSSTMFALGRSIGAIAESVGWGVSDIRSLHDRFYETWELSRELVVQLTAHLNGVPKIELLSEIHRRGHWYCRISINGEEEEITRQLAEGLLALNQSGKVVEFPMRQLQQGSSAEKPWVCSLFTLVPSSTRSGYYADYSCPTFRGTLRDRRPADGRTIQPYQRSAH